MGAAWRSCRRRLLRCTFLKLRRQPLEVPSTYLWKQSIEDMHVNSLWQRLRQNLLLFLQLLLVALAMLALLRPGWEGTKLDGERFIFLVDNSASMSATDVDGAKNRLEEAKKLVGGLIDQMDSGMTAMIISFADTPQVVQEFTEQSPACCASGWRRFSRPCAAPIFAGALDLADGLANPGRMPTQEGDAEIDVVEAQPATVYIFSDGRFEDVKGFSLGNLKPFYVPIGSLEAKNLAITAFSTRRSEAKPEERQAFVQVANFTEAAQKVVVELQLDGSFLDAKEVEVPAGESSGVVFPLADAPAGKLTAQLKYELDTPTKRDALAQDDIGLCGAQRRQAGPRARRFAGQRGAGSCAGDGAGRASWRISNSRRQTMLTSEQYKSDADGGAYDLDHLRSMRAGGDAAGEHAVHRPAAAGAGVARRRKRKRRTSDEKAKASSESTATDDRRRRKAVRAADYRLGPLASALGERRAGQRRYCRQPRARSAAGRDGAHRFDGRADRGDRAARRLSGRRARI